MSDEEEIRVSPDAKPEEELTRKLMASRAANSEPTKKKRGRPKKGEERTKPKEPRRAVDIDGRKGASDKSAWVAEDGATPNEQRRVFVACAAMNGLSHEAIADLMGCSPNRLWINYAHELQHGKNDIITRATTILYKKVFVEEDWKALHFLLKTRGGFRETTEISGPGGGPIETTSKIDFSSLDESERSSLREILQKRSSCLSE